MRGRSHYSWLIDNRSEWRGGAVVQQEADIEGDTLLRFLKITAGFQQTSGSHTHGFCRRLRGHVHVLAVRNPGSSFPALPIFI